MHGLSIGQASLQAVGKCWSVHGEGIGKASLQAGSGQVLVWSGQALAVGKQQRLYADWDSSGQSVRQ